MSIKSGQDHFVQVCGGATVFFAAATCIAAVLCAGACLKRVNGPSGAAISQGLPYAYFDNVALKRPKALGSDLEPDGCSSVERSSP